METHTKNSLFLSQAGSFNFELNSDELLQRALGVGFVVKIGDDLYEVNDDYDEINQDDLDYQADTY